MRPPGGARLMVGLPGLEVDDVSRRLLRETGARSVILFGRNVLDATQVSELVAEIRETVPWPLLIAVDQEGGAVARIVDGAFGFPGARALGALPRDSRLALARRAGRLIGLDLAGMGIDLNLAPVVDVLHDHSRTGLELRSFGGDPDDVSQLAEAFLTGQREGGVRGCIKHYPGLGVAAADPHGELPVIPEDLVTDFERDRDVFRRLLESGAAAAVMTTHLVAPGATGEWITGSRPEVYERLRGAWRFDGLILADCLEMGGASKRAGGSLRAVLEAARAGHDVLPVCHTAELQLRASEALEAALESGELKGDEHEASVARIEALAGSHRKGGGEVEDGPALARLIARRAFRVVADPAHLLPLERGTRLAMIRVGPAREGMGVEEVSGRAGSSAFFRRWAERGGGQIRDIRLSTGGGGDALEGGLSALSGNERILFFPRHARDDPLQQTLLRRLGRRFSKGLIVCAMRDDRDLAFAPPSATLLAGYGERPEQWEVLAERLLGAPSP